MYMLAGAEKAFEELGEPVVMSNNSTTPSSSSTINQSHKAPDMQKMMETIEVRYGDKDVDVQYF